MLPALIFHFVVLLIFSFLLFLLVLAFVSVF